MIPWAKAAGSRPSMDRDEKPFKRRWSLSQVTPPMAIEER